MSQENPIIVSAGEWINANRRLHISWNMQPFWEWPKSLSWMAIAVAMEMTADHLEPIVQDAILRTSTEEASPILDIDIFLPEAIRKAAAAIRDQSPNMGLFAEQMVESFNALIDTLTEIEGPLSPTERRIGLLGPSLSFSILGQGFSSQRPLNWELAGNWVQWMYYLLIVSMDTLPPRNIQFSSPLHQPPSTFYYLAVYTGTWQEVNDEFLPIARDLTEEWWERFQDTLPWRYAMSSPLE